MCDLSDEGVLSSCTILYTRRCNFQQLAVEVLSSAYGTDCPSKLPSPSPPAKQGWTPIWANTLAFGLLIIRTISIFYKNQGFLTTIYRYNTTLLFIV
jgi:hypothetical protein